ncbi:putative neuroguidin [Scophthalmus maximus]|uniref:Neuroguidin, EIF4E binding protein n=1 Tax=Scophthalmus maximus TaxID=52904 RepID=A0A2U9CYE6_SCOMX|nr:neuroguidin isoform X1 [Scophthalmus maximus]AWP20859.1 putative neuroguidin [Scophthalmus maximus]
MAAPVDNGLIESDLPKAVELLNNLTEQVASVTSHVRELLTRVKDGAFNTSKGLSFLDLRYHLLLFYLQDLTHLISIKSEGGKIKDSEALDRVVTIRTVLEKMRPLDHKLKYQIDKLVRTAVTGSLAENDPLQLRPNPENLISKLNDSEGSEDEAEGTAASETGAAHSSGRKYVPPKIAPVHYDGDVTEADRKKAQVERQKRAALRSSVIQELRQQYSDAPEEIRDRRDFQSDRESRDETHRKNYEESMMVRLNMPKNQKNTRKRGMMAMTGQLSGITHFGDITALTGGEDRQDGESNRPKKKKKVMKKKTKRRAFKKHR